MLPQAHIGLRLQDVQTEMVREYMLKMAAADMRLLYLSAEIVEDRYGTTQNKIYMHGEVS